MKVPAGPECRFACRRPEREISHVEVYVKRKNNGAADAEAICEAVRRPTMRFVRFKSAEHP
jgi:transposase